MTPLKGKYLQRSLANCRRRLLAAWQDDPPLGPPVSWLLAGAAALYGGGVRLRAHYTRCGKPAACKIISIGNLSVGGTGKTPMTIYLAQRIQATGRRIAIVSRGYKGGLEKSGGLVSDGDRILCDVQAAGDEPLMLAARLPGIPVLVGRDRAGSIQRAKREFQAQVVILDDGFQHIGVGRDLDLVLMERHCPLGNGRLLPAGPLREPLRALKRAQALVLIDRAETAATKQLPDALCNLDLPVFEAATRPRVRGVVPAGRRLMLNTLQQPGKTTGREFLGKRIFGFSGIARNVQFRRTLTDFDWTLAGFSGFGDHHDYTPQDLTGIRKGARRSKAEFMATTEKDYVRLLAHDPWPLAVIVVGLDIYFQAPGKLDALIERYV